MSADHRYGYNSVTALLKSPLQLAGFERALTTNQALCVGVIREVECYARQSQIMKAVILTVENIIGGIMGIGAIFEAPNTMYSAVSSRSR
ncbi:MAG: hypothetical protein ACRETB_10945 [Steroidobacteraceae bacterium]